MSQVEQTTRQTINQMFNARSVAVIGASNNPGKYGYMTVASMLKGGYEGKIYPVNPKGGEILGLKAYRSLKDLPETPDVAVIVIPVHLVPDVMKEAAEIGIPGVGITSAGFSEVGRNDLQEAHEIYEYQEMQSLKRIISGSSDRTSRASSTLQTS